MSFAHLGLSQPLARAVEALNYTEATPIQAKAIPKILEGRDLVGLAETGSGKTAAYLLPIFDKLQGGTGLRALVVAPTRELAVQIDGVATGIAKDLGMKVVTVIGGQRLSGQLNLLRQGCDVLVATPGRLLDLVRGRNVSLKNVRFFVLDEADRLFDMGFLPDVRSIIKQLPADRQSMLFSATLSAEVEGLAYETLVDPVTVVVGKRSSTVESVHQAAYKVQGHHRTPLLLRLADEVIDGPAIVFTETKKGADQLAHILKVNGHDVETMHADRSQGERTAALDRFKKGKVKFLVATDVAARGLDIDSVSFVVNYDVPQSPDSYVHRIGRTARAGRKGTALTLYSPMEEANLKAIENLTGSAIERRTLDGFKDGTDDMVAAFLATATIARSRGARSHARRR